MVKRANYVGAPQIFNLSHACQAIVSAFGPNVYLVGSSLERRDFRDVDVRCMLDDADFDALFPHGGVNAVYNARLSLMNVAISGWLSERSGLPIDFQFQRRTEANDEFKGHRSALGLFFHVGEDDETAT